MIYKIIRKFLDTMLYNRADDREILYYFSEKDFSGLVKEDYTFKSREASLPATGSMTSVSTLPKETYSAAIPGTYP